MAEAAAAAPRHRFFCHCCRGEIDPKLPEYVCPRCDSGFIEEVSENSSFLQSRDGAGAAAVGGDDMASQFAELWQLLFMEHSALLSDPTVTDALRSRSGVEAAVGDPASGTAGPVASVETLSDCTEPVLPPQQNSQQRNSRLDQGQAMEGIVQQFLSGLFSNSDSAGSQTSSWSSMLHSNPGDYAWGQGGLDVVITQLLGQSENTGPLPAGKEMISSLPIVSISLEQHAGWNALCVERSTPKGNLSNSCPVCTTFTATVSCPGYNCTTPALSAGKVWMVKTGVSSHRPDLQGQFHHR
ncbi:E3 ubiquitin-protein ligase RNF115-like isoform X2 [Sinocyclocheilus anshuiensis]|uniref:E3 ubiquitin-protein ligase RNF115-like isoform X2 n=1 Tax=Sinocyclocheilus anshuiensis TaxID=1608454 RepID=UPI0007B8F64A|nr:PREDICTED: E3 ubiquitin-protein ligase RNF115-like isoform X2 [Sinocyclocheilus anshuiensis]